MPKWVSIYVKKQLRLDKLTISQQEMYRLGQVGLASIKSRVTAARGPNDSAAPRLKSKSWIRIKVAKGLKPVRDLRGTGRMSTAVTAGYRHKALKRKAQLRDVGHLLDQLLVRRVKDDAVSIEEPTSLPGRIKARGNSAMLQLSQANLRAVYAECKRILQERLKRLGIRKAA
jgi:hypothetical protein